MRDEAEYGHDREVSAGLQQFSLKCRVLRQVAGVGAVMQRQQECAAGTTGTQLGCGCWQSWGHMPDPQLMPCVALSLHSSAHRLQAVGEPVPTVELPCWAPLYLRRRQQC